MNGKSVFEAELTLDMVTQIVAALRKDGDFPYIKEINGELYGNRIIDIKVVSGAKNMYTLVVERCGLLN